MERWVDASKRRAEAAQAVAARKALHSERCAKLAADAKHLRDQGLAWPAVSAALGVSTMYVLRVTHDHYPEIRKRPYKSRSKAATKALTEA
jgi:hypothetical protein